MFNVLAEIFKWDGLHNNMRKTVNMACQPCSNIGGHYTEAYGLWTTVEGVDHQERLF